jgi:hypothetical protein
MTPGPAAAAATVLRRLGMAPVAGTIPYVRGPSPGNDAAREEQQMPDAVARYATAAQRITELETERGLSPPHAGKEHLGRIRRSGLFRAATEIAVHGTEQGDAGRLVAVALSSQGGAVALLAAGASEDELGLTALREVAARRLPRPRTWWWTYRIRLAVK